MSLRPAAALLLAACLPSPQVGPAQQSAGYGPPTALSTIASTIFVPRCATASCHTGNPPPQAPGSYDAGLVWENIVGVPSLQSAGMNVVEPGAPERSYLVHKLRGTAGDVGGIATVMPLSDAPLDESDIEAIEAWIAAGAPND
jgi:hypothetical protein